MNYIAVDGSAAPGKFGFGIFSDKIKISSPVKNCIVSGISYPNIFYDETQFQQATNNRGELLGMLYCHHYIETLGVGQYTIICDSQYVINTITLWFPARLAKGTEHEVLNYDIISLLYQKSLQMSNNGYVLIYKWQKAHMTQKAMNALTAEKKYIAKLNETADELAQQGYKYHRPTILN
jgi:ribonuclease HI